jgi:hypothetical protein
MHDEIHISIFGSPADPRMPTPPPPGVVVHYQGLPHPEDLCVVDGIPVTPPARTLVDLAEVMDREELRATFRRARELGLLDIEAVRRARARVEWRPSLGMLDEVIAEFGRL